MLSFGIEEEFVFLDAATLAPIDLANAVFSEFYGDPNFGRSVYRDLLACQLRYSSPLYGSLEHARDDLLRFRRRLTETAAAFDAVAAGVGTPFSSPGCPKLTRGEGSDELRRGAGALVDELRVNALHVHVPVHTREQGVAVLNRVRVWLPVLLALSANSPFSGEVDTGFASWRAVLLRRWTTAGCPPVFADAEDYARRETALLGIGATVDRAAIGWNARLTPGAPIVEIRVADAQLDGSDTALVAALCRALVATALADADEERPLPGQEPELLDAALWHAARDGLSDQLVSPVDGELHAASAVLRELRTHLDVALCASGDAALVDTLLDRLVRIGTGAARQRAVFADGGSHGLSELLATPGARSFLRAPGRSRS